MAYLAGSALLVPNTLPVLLGSVRRLFALSDLEMGLVNTVYSAACLATAATAPVWLDRVRAPLAGLVASIALVASFLLLPKAGGAAGVYGLFAAIGLAAGAAGALGNAGIGRLPEAARWFGVSAALQLVIAAVYGLAGPILLARVLGAEGALGAVALAFVPCVVASWWLRDTRAARTTGGQGVSASRRAAGGGDKRALACAFAAFFLYVLPMSSFWIFAERVGEGKGVPAGWIATGVAAGIASAVTGSILFSAISRRLRLAAALTLGGALGSYALLMVPSVPAFVAGVVLFNIAWGMAVPAFLSIIRAVDFTNRLYVSGTAMILLASTVAGPPAALVVGRFGLDGLLIACAGVTALAFVVLRGVHLPAGTPAPAAAVAGH